jgi:hypothetical protein
MKTYANISLLVLGSAAAALAQGTILWDESVNGELSRNYATATPLAPLQPGTNSVLGATEVVPTGPNWAAYPDFFTITVPSGQVVDALYLSINKPNVWTWIGDASFYNQLAFTQNPSTGDLLAQWGVSSIGPGVYGMYLDNGDVGPVTSIATYRLDFISRSVPEPHPIALLLAASCPLAAFRCWRKFRSAQPRRGP